MAMGAVKALMNALATRTGSAWIDTSGGCYAVQVLFGSADSQYEILITDREDVFSDVDLHSNDTVSGFNAILRVFDPVEELFPDESAVTVYRTSDDAGVCLCQAFVGERLVDLMAEVDRCAVAVENMVEMVLRAERDGRGQLMFDPFDGRQPFKRL